MEINISFIPSLFISPKDILGLYPLSKYPGHFITYFDVAPSITQILTEDLMSSVFSIIIAKNKI